MKKKLLIGLASLVGLVIIIVIIVLTNGPTPLEPGTLTVHFIDVRQGDSILLDLGDIEVLIDGGGKSPGIISYIDDYVDGPLEVMVATHPHADHIGGLIAVLGVFKVDEIWLNGDTRNSKTYSQFISAVDAEDAREFVARRGDTIQAGNLTFNVLHPVNLSDTINNNSIVLSFSYGQIDFLFTADAEEEIATNLVAPIHLSALLIPHLRRQREPAIVNISSGLAFTPLSAVPVYCATKAAIHSLSLTMRFQLRETPIRVFEIAPPIVPTGLSGQRRRPEDSDHSMSPSDVAKGVVRALRNDTYEVALGSAARLHKRREALFSAIND